MANIGKSIKEQLIKKASSNSDKFFPTKLLKKLGFKRENCKLCKKYFWTSETREICGDVSCINEYGFIGKSPCGKKFEFGEFYCEFRKFMEKRGYKNNSRFPVVARFRDDLDFTIASIIGFQPYVTKGIIEPKNKLTIIPQNCLRFLDIDNVGVTGRHGTNFVMVGQLAFEKEENYNQEKYLKDLLDWFLDGMKILKSEIQIHEDAWLGGGDCGASLEFFCRGLEIANQVYITHNIGLSEKFEDLKSLKIKVLDTGVGLERCVWLSKGSINQDEANSEKVCKYLFDKTKLNPNWNSYKKFLIYSGNLNLDEVDDVEKVWSEISKKVGVDVLKLKCEIEPISAIYSICDHTKTLLYALCDGALLTNTKGGYNLRLILRRTLDFICKFKFKLDLFEVMKMHAKECKNLYPEFEKDVLQIKKILDLEVERYFSYKEKVSQKIKDIAKKNTKLSLENFISLYTEKGISPFELKVEFEKLGKKLDIPSNFFTKVGEFFENRKKNNQKNEDKKNLKKFIEKLPKTNLEFYNDMGKDKLISNIISEFEVDKKKYVVLDRTLFYPESGGQAYDLGFIGDFEVVGVEILDGVVLHQIK